MSDDLFDEELVLPDRHAQERLDALVGLDSVKETLSKSAAVLLDPESLTAWSNRYHGRVLPVVKTVRRRTPLFVFAGDIGTGKSTLAETFAQRLATEREIRVTVLRLSLRARGSGAVGEMTKLLGEAFEAVVQRGRRDKAKGSALVLVIDEADAIAQSRELAQMHHEDRAGVNALIRGIDTVAGEELPIVVVLCTNRLEALDPAVRRRAAAEFEFTRPDEVQRLAVLSGALGDTVSREELQELAARTGNGGQRDYGYTYSDLVQRVLPAAVLAAYPDQALTFQLLTEAIAAHAPTPPFHGP